MLGGRDKIVLYTEAPTQRLESISDDKVKSVRGFVEDFLTDADDAFEGSGVSDNINRICGIHFNVFVVHCINIKARAECCIVLDIYKAKNEEDYISDIEEYESDAHDYKRNFEELDKIIYQRWLEQMQYFNDKILVTET